MPLLEAPPGLPQTCAFIPLVWDLGPLLYLVTYQVLRNMEVAPPSVHL